MAKTASAKAPKATKATKVSKNSKAVKKAEPVKQKIEDESASSSSSSSESDSDSSESESEDEKKSKKSKKVTKKVTKKDTKKAAKKEESSDSSSSESESEKEEAKADSSDSDSSSDDEEEEEKVVAKKEESSSDSSESEEEAKKEESDSSDSDSSSDEKEKAKSDSSDSDSSDGSDSDSSDEEEEKDTEMAEAAINGKRKADTDAESPAKVAKVETDEVHTVWVGGLDFNATGEDVRQFFAECGTVIDARIVNDRNTGRSKGYGYVDFADAESKAEAKKYHETEFMGRQIRVDDAPTRGAQPRDNGAQRSKPLSNKSDTVFVGNISFECDDHTLREAFEGFGNIIGVRLPTDRETGSLKGYGYVQFDSEDAAEKAVNEMNGYELLGRGLRTDFGGARPAGGDGGGRGGFGGGRGGGRGGFGGRGGGRGGNRGGFGGGRGGGRGGFGGNRGGFSSGPSGSHVKF